MMTPDEHHAEMTLYCAWLRGVSEQVDELVDASGYLGASLRAHARLLEAAVSAGWCTCCECEARARGVVADV